MESVSRKLAVLLDRRADQRVLLVGARGLAWSADFGRHFAECHAAPSWDVVPTVLGEGPSCGLVFWDSTAAADAAAVRAGLALARRALADDGVLALLVANRWSLRLAKAALGRRGGRLAPAGLEGYSRLMTSAGFGPPEAFLPLPSLANTEEYVHVGSPAFELPSHTHFALRAAVRLALFTRLHDGFLLLAGRGPSAPTWRLLEWLRGELAAAGMTGNLYLDRFDLRARGALAIFVRLMPAGRSLVVRFALHPSHAAVIGRNATWTTRLLSDPRIAAAIGHWLPRPLATCARGDTTAYVEERLQGMLAWKVTGRPAARAAIDADALAFLEALAAATSVLYPPAAPPLAALLDEPLAQVAASLSHFPALQHAARGAAAAIRATLTTRQLACIVGHGDFGYGNLVVHPATGNLVGVIDWDCAREIELPGVDWANLLVQRQVQLTGGELVSAVRVVWESAAAGADGEDRWPGMAAPGADRRTSVAMAALRYVLRAARYPAQLGEHAAEFTTLLEWVAREYARA